MCVPDEQGLGSWWVTPLDRDGFCRRLLLLYVLRTRALLSTRPNSISFKSSYSFICDCAGGFTVELLPAGNILVAPFKGVNLKTVEYFMVKK